MGGGNIRLILFLVNAGLVLLVVGTVVAVVGLFGNDSPSVQAEYPRFNVRLPQGVVMRSNPTVSLDVPDPTTKQRLLSFGTAVVEGVLIALGLWLLRGVAVSVRDGDPFGRANVRRLRGLGFLLLVGAPIGAVIQQSLRWQLVNTLPPGRYRDAMAPTFGLPVVVMLVGVGVFVLAEVFAYGVRLREDVEATI